MCRCFCYEPIPIVHLQLRAGHSSQALCRIRVLVQPRRRARPTESPTAKWTTSKDDWKPSLKIVSKQCDRYGFGCSIDAKVKLGYDGDSSSIPEDATVEVTYKIKGAKNGPIVVPRW